ncbi:MAG TPA: hypothetical protein VG474_06330 [Solirubrobacteraceae bacterium]|nr:hypothetical protein [Solirubrobacteraceae bacterium]
MQSRILLAVAVVAVACTGEMPSLAAAGASEGAGRHAANNPFRASMISHCVRAKRPARVRALAFDGTQLPVSVAAGHEPGSRPRCRPDELRLLRLQALSIAGERTYVRRGGCALPCVVRQPTVHVPASAFVGRVRLLPRAARNGNGEPVSGCGRQVRTAPQLAGRALRRMFYKTPAELRRRRNAGRSGGIGASWSNYGDPGGTYRSPAGRVAHYNYLLWNLPRTPAGVLPGGGIVRAVLPAGQPIVLCEGQRLSLPAFDRRGIPSGHVDVGYARVRSAARAGASTYAIHGWVLLGYRYRETPYVTLTADDRPESPGPTPRRPPAAPSAGA